MKRLFLSLAICIAVAAFGFTAPLGGNEGFVLMNDLPLWQEQAGVLKYVEGLTIGDKVAMLNRSGKFKQDGKEKEFVKVRALDGKEGWVRAQYVAPKSSLAVVKADRAIAYSEPRDVKVTDKYVSNMAIVAVTAEAGGGSFSMIRAYDKSQDRFFGDSTYVRAEDLTSEDADINAAILFTVASATKNKDIKKNLLTVAANKYGSSIFMDRIQAALGDGGGSTASAPTPGMYVVNANKVNVRSAPDEKNGPVVAQLDQDVEVEVLDVTDKTYTVGERTAAWYRIKDPAGWVFGGFLTPLP